MTHEGILRVNEFFNNKLAKATENIKFSLVYRGNFGNQALFQSLRKVVKRAGYDDVNGQLDTLFCIVDGLKNGHINDAITTAALSGTSRTYLSTKDVIDIFGDVMTKGKLAFDDRVRRDTTLALYLTSTNFCIRTKFMTLQQHKEYFKSFIYPLMSLGLFICKEADITIDSADLYHQVYNNAKTTISNMNSRGMSLFAIACYFWLQNKDFMKTPFMHNWSNVNFMSALTTTPLFKAEASEEVKKGLSSPKPYWTVISDLSVMTGRVANVDDRRKNLNIIINKVLDSEGESFIRDYLKQIKLVASQNPIAGVTIPANRDVLRNTEKVLQQVLRERSTKIPSKELIIEAIKYQFMISRILDVDFSSKRKDHIVFDKATRKRIFDIL